MNNTPNITIGESWDPIACMAFAMLEGGATKPIVVEVVFDSTVAPQECHFATWEQSYSNEAWAKLTSQQRAETLASGIMAAWETGILGSVEETEAAKLPTITYEVVVSPEGNATLLFAITPK